MTPPRSLQDQDNILLMDDGTPTKKSRTDAGGGDGGGTKVNLAELVMAQATAAVYGTTSSPCLSAWDAAREKRTQMQQGWAPHSTSSVALELF